MRAVRFLMKRTRLARLDRRTWRPKATAVLGVFAFLGALTLFIVGSENLPWDASDPASAAVGGPEMALNVEGGVCNDPVRPTKCSVVFGSPFEISVHALVLPANGYDTMQTFIDYGSDLVYKPVVPMEDEIVWPDAVFLLAAEFSPGLLYHAGSTSLTSPRPKSNYVGKLVAVAMNCPDASTVTKVDLLPYNDPVALTNGSLFVEAGTLAQVIPKVGSLTINCVQSGTVEPTQTPTPTPALTLSVNSTADAVDAFPGNGTCATAGAVCTLRAAIQEANALALSVTEITVPSGTYTLTIIGNSEDIAATGDLDITTDLYIVGVGNPTIAQSTDDRVLHILAGNDAFIAGLTIADGALPAGQSGAGIFNQGNLTLVQSTVRDNDAIDRGGGIYQLSATAVIVGSTINDNAAGDTGGGIVSTSSTLTIVDSTISGNASDGSGGGIAQVGVTSEISIRSATITGNIADADVNGSGTGGGVFLDLGVSTVRNTIIAGNTGVSSSSNDCSGTWTSAGYNLIGHDDSCTFSATSGDQVGTLAVPIDPKLGPLTDNGGSTLTHSLNANSPAVDAGDPTTPAKKGIGCYVSDQRGVARPIDGDLDTNARCDIGAYEAAGAATCSAVQCLSLDLDADFFVTAAGVGLSNDPCNASGAMHISLDAVGDSNGDPNGKEDQAFTIDFVSGWLDCPGPMYSGSSIPSTGYIEEQNDTTAGLDFPVDVTLILCLEIDTLTPLGLIQNCGTGLTKSPIVVECTAASYDEFDCAIVTTGGAPEFRNTSGTPVAAVDSSDTITMTAMGELAFPGDSDGDGCPDANENQGKSAVANGGGRDSLDPWDWYDVNQDGVIDLINDIIGVIGHWQPIAGGASPYDIAFDRGPSAGPNPWNTTAPDGIIDLVNDIIGVIHQWSPLGCT